MIESEGITENVRSWRTDVPARLIEALGLERIMFPTERFAMQRGTRVSSHGTNASLSPLFASPNHDLVAYAQTRHMHEEAHMTHVHATDDPIRRPRDPAEPPPLATIFLTHEHNSVREGTVLGLVVATCIWVWLAAVDAIAGKPFLTFTVLGGIAGFTVMHYLLNVAYGVAIMSIVHTAARAPSAIFAVGFGFLMLEFAFALVTAAFSSGRLGELAWVRLFGGSVIGAVIAIVIVTRRHPLVALLHHAEEEI